MILLETHLRIDAGIRNNKISISNRFTQVERVNECMIIRIIAISSCNDNDATNNVCARTAPLLSLSSARLSPKKITNDVLNFYVMCIKAAIKMDGKAKVIIVAACKINSYKREIYIAFKHLSVVVCLRRFHFQIEFMI